MSALEELRRGLSDPPGEFGPIPFWFWNDDLDDREILRQIADFQRHGVHGFVIHPRVGLPRSLGWMSDALLRHYATAIEEAARRGMKVMLYDEGMYPSGSSSGQVVAEDQRFACRGLVRRDLPEGREAVPGPGENLLAVVRRSDGSRMAVYDRRLGSTIRGLHYDGEGPKEDAPPAADILNPEAVSVFLRLVYDGFAARFSRWFGSTVTAVFTDEPGIMGRYGGTEAMPGTTDILSHVNRILGYDFTPHLPALWSGREPDAPRYRRDYERAVHVRLEETYYRPLSRWCAAHGIALAGHPAVGDEMDSLRWFQIPGQDLVWRRILPDHPSALQGPESTQAKGSSSAMRHAGRRRNANEFCGAYGHELSWADMLWLSRWCLVRGVNLLVPHAFYYSVRGPRLDERPPDVGPHSPWWERYREHADEVRRLCWLDVEAAHVCGLAILAPEDRLPWRAAEACFRNQRDFNYLSGRDIGDRAVLDREGIRVEAMSYGALIVEEEPAPKLAERLAPLADAGRLLRWGEGAGEAHLLERLEALVPADVRLKPACPAVRVRHVVKAGVHAYLLFNEESSDVETTVSLSVQGPRRLYDPVADTLDRADPAGPLRLPGHALRVILVEKDG